MYNTNYQYHYRKKWCVRFLPSNGEGTSVRSEVRPWGIQLFSLVLNTRNKQVSTISTSLPVEERWRPSCWKMGGLLGSIYFQKSFTSNLNTLEISKSIWLRDHPFPIAYFQWHTTALLKQNLLSTSDGSQTISSSPLSTQTANQIEQFCIFYCTSVPLKEQTLAHYYAGCVSGQWYWR